MSCSDSTQNLGTQPLAFEGITLDRAYENLAWVGIAFNVIFLAVVKHYCSYVIN
jgi:hypothetical protein